MQRQATAEATRAHYLSHDPLSLALCWPWFCGVLAATGKPAPHDTNSLPCQPNHQRAMHPWLLRYTSGKHPPHSKTAKTSLARGLRRQMLAKTATHLLNPKSPKPQYTKPSRWGRAFGYTIPAPVTLVNSDGRPRHTMPRAYPSVSPSGRVPETCAAVAAVDGRPGHTIPRALPSVTISVMHHEHVMQHGGGGKA